MITVQELIDALSMVEDKSKEIDCEDPQAITYDIRTIEEGENMVKIYIALTMERKIGEIFEYNGEWYQCVESQDGSCKHCDMNFEGKCPIPIKECTESGRSDKSYVIFKKLEKVGEPYSDYCPSGRIIYFQRYKCYQKPIYTGNFICWADDINISIEIKQTKEDMEEKKLNLKPFDIQKAREGKPVCTRDGRKTRILCYDFKQNEEYPILVAVENKDGKECALLYSNDGISEMYKSSNNELAMLPEKKEGWAIIRRSDIYETEEQAKKVILDSRIGVMIRKVEWEE